VLRRTPNRLGCLLPALGPLFELGCHFYGFPEIQVGAARFCGCIGSMSFENCSTVDDWQDRRHSESSVDWNGATDYVGAVKVDSGLRTVGKVSDSGRNFPRDDDGRGDAAAEPAGGIPAGRVVAGGGQERGSRARFHAWRIVADAHLQPDVGRICAGL
jgi:hypothetical protein